MLFLSELNDKPLLDLCESLHIIKYTEDEKESEDAERALKEAQDDKQ